MKNTKKLLADALRETGLDLSQSADDVAAFALHRATHLAAIAGQAGFGEALADEAQRVWLYAADRTVRAGDAADARVFGLLHGVLLGAAG